MSLTPKFVYEVNLTIQANTFVKNKDWLLDHFHDMVLENKFIKLELYYVKNTDPINDNNLRETQITAQYFIKDYPSLLRYFEKKARSMRDQVVERLNCNYTVYRRVLESIETFQNEDVS